MMDPESHGPCDQSKKTATRVLHMQNYSRALTLFSATGPLGTVLKAVLECDQIASKLSDKIAAVSERWEWSNLNDESSVEWTTLISDFDSDEGPWSLKSFEKKKLKSADFDKWDVTLRIKVLGGVFTILNDESDRRYSEICTALGNLKNHGRNKVIHSGPAEWRETAYGNLKKTVLNGIKKLLDSEENVQSLQQLKEDIPKWIEFIVQGKCCMLNSKAKRNSIRELMKVIKDHLDKSSADDLKKIKDHFGLDEETEAASLLVYISTELPDDHRRQVRRFISKFMPDREALILNTPPHHNAWLEGYTVTFKFLEHVKLDDENLKAVNKLQKNIAEIFSAVFKHIRYGCMELSFVMESIHAYCLPAKILNPEHFDELLLLGQRPVVTVFGCLAFSPSKDKYWSYFMGTKDTHAHLLKEYEFIADKGVSLDQEDRSLLEESKKILVEKLTHLEDDSSEDDPSEDDPSEDDPSEGPPVPLPPMSLPPPHREQWTYEGPPVPLPPMSLPPPHREQWTYEDWYEVRPSDVTRLAVVFCNNIPEEELTQKSHWWKDALAHRKFDVQVVKDATLSTFEDFCRDCEGREYVAFVFIGESNNTGKSINFPSGDFEETTRTMAKLTTKILKPLLVNRKLESCRMMMFFETTNPIRLDKIDGVTKSAECKTEYIAAASSDKGDFSKEASEALITSESRIAFEDAILSKVGKNVYTDQAHAKWDLWPAQGKPSSPPKKVGVSSASSK